MKKVLKKSLVCFMVIALLLSSLVISASAVSGSEIVSYARQFVGCAYVSGGKGPSSFDCSGFVYYVFKHFGISLPSASSPYWSNPTNYGTVIATGSTSQAKAGDIIVWSGHVAIYTENGYCVEALNSKYGVTDRFKVNDHTNGMNYKVLRIYGVGDGYTLSYNANGGYGAPAAQTGASSYTIPSTIPTRFGYTFEGWNTDKNAVGGYYPEYHINISQNTTLYATWKNDSDVCSINFPSQEVYYKFVPSSSEYYVIEIYGLSDNFDVKGYLYDSAGNQLAYNDDRNAEGLGLSSRDSRIVHYLYAGNTYYLKATAWSGNTGTVVFSPLKVPELRYNANGGSGAPSTQTDTNWLLTSKNYTVSSTIPTRTNYTFLGWSTNSNATSAEYQPGSSIELDFNTDSLTLYAVWRYNPPATPSTYTLTYNANGGTGAPSSQSGATSYAISSTVPHRVGYTFLGWSTSSSDSSFTYIPGNTITLSSNTTLYASWQAARTVNTSSSNLANINFENQVRAYKFTPSSSGTYVFESSGSADSKIYLYNSSGTEIAKDDDSGNGNNFKLSYNLNAGSTYYLGVRLYSTETGEVSFTVKKESSSQGSTYKCSYCNNIFTSESEYNKHLANCNGNINNSIKVTIRNNPGTRTLNYGDTVRIYADAQNLPAGAKIGWYVDDGSTISAKVSDDGTYCDITATGNGTVTLAAKAVDANGNVMTDSNGYQIADVQKINTKTSLWLRIVSFFKNLFGINRTTVQLFKGLF